MRADSLVEIRDAYLDLGSNEVFSEITLKLYAGEMLALIGSNGAGKSSLLRAISGELALKSGSISFLNKRLSDWPLKARAKNLAVLPQHSELSFPYTVEEVVGLSRLPHASGYKYDREVVSAAITAMDLLTLRNKPYTQLSGGEKQRTQLARVLAQVWPNDLEMQPSLILLDEPCNTLDPGHIELLVKHLKIFCQKGAAIVMVVHDVNFAAQHADRIIALHQGKLIADGTPREVVQTELLNTLYSANGQVFLHPLRGYPVYL